MGADASLTPAVVPVRPGGEAEAELSVRNTGGVVDRFSVEILGAAAAWAECDPPTLSLFPGQAETVRVRFRLPAGTSTPPGPLPFGVRIVAAEDAAHPTVEEGALDIAPVPVLSADISPRTGRARGRRAGRYQLAVDNRGNAAAVVDLAGWDTQDLVDVTVTPPSVEVAAGGAAFVTVRARARNRVWRGANVLHRFSVGVRPAGDPQSPDAPEAPQPLEASLLQEPAIPGWVPKVAMLAVLGLIAVAVLWFAVLKPVVRDAATSATNAALLANGITPAPSGPSVSGGGGSGGGGSKSGSGSGPSPSPSSSAVTVPTTPAAPSSKAPPPPVAFATELLSNQLLTADAKQTLTVTDLVLQNPNGDTGTLTITRAGKVLISTRLENYRDYDLHFVTPITISPGQTLGVDVGGPCKPGGGNTQCTPAVLVSGMSGTA
jgi:hypothetical protein